MIELNLFERKINHLLVPRSMIPEDGYCRNRPERCGKITVSGRKARESTGKHWKLEAVFQLEVTGFFSCGFRSVSCVFRSVFCVLHLEVDRNLQEKNPVTSNWNTASTFQRFPVLSGRFPPYVHDLGIKYNKMNTIG